MSNGEYFMFCIGFIASAGMFYNIGIIRTQRKYLDKVLDLSVKYHRHMNASAEERNQ